MLLDRILTLASNLLPLAGVWWWNWDAFEVLILYWMQTVLMVFFTVLRVRKLPVSRLGDIKAGGRMRPATHRDYMLLLGGVGLVFCAGHLGFLWVFFSGGWSKLVHGPVTFWQHFVIANGAWIALLFNVGGGVLRHLLTPRNGQPGDIDDLQLTLFIRIFAMQAAIIFGAMLVMSYGASSAPLLILIGLKTLFDLGASFPPRTKALTAERR